VEDAAAANEPVDANGLKAGDFGAIAGPSAI